VTIDEMLDKVLECVCYEQGHPEDPCFVRGRARKAVETFVLGVRLEDVSKAVAWLAEQFGDVELESTPAMRKLRASQITALTVRILGTTPDIQATLENARREESIRLDCADKACAACTKTTTGHMCPDMVKKDCAIRNAILSVQSERSLK